MDIKAALQRYLYVTDLYPFYGTLILYMLLYQPLIGYPSVIISAAFFKVLPIWSLAFFVFRKNKSFKTLMDNDYSKFIFVGLMMSTLGDAFLVARITLFIPGMLAFAVAHVFYILAFEPPGADDNSKMTNLYILGYIAVAVTLVTGIESVLMFCLVMIYVTLIVMMSWRATCLHEKHKTFQTFAACVGSLLFVFSDLMIAVDKWKITIPFIQFFVMITYYAAQFFIAISTDNRL